MTPIEEYLSHIVRIVSTLTNIEVDYYSEQILSPTRANLRFRIRFSTYNFAEVSEAIELRDESLFWLSYRYHFQYSDKFLRYDDAPHHPDIKTHPEHRHDNLRIEASNRPALDDFLREITKQMGLQ